MATPTMEESQEQMAAATVQLAKVQTAHAQASMLATYIGAMRTAHELAEKLTGEQRRRAQDVYRCAERKAEELTRIIDGAPQNG